MCLEIYGSANCVSFADKKFYNTVTWWRFKNFKFVRSFLFDWAFIWQFWASFLLDGAAQGLGKKQESQTRAKISSHIKAFRENCQVCSSGFRNVARTNQGPEATHLGPIRCRKIVRQRPERSFSELSDLRMNHLIHGWEFR